MSPAVRSWMARLAAAALAGSASLAFPAPSWWWMGWVGLAPVFVLIAGSPSRREALLRAWLGGAVFLTVLHAWIIPFAGVLIVPLAAAMGLSWIPIGLAAWSFLRPEAGTARHRAGFVVVPAAWVLVEWARSWEYLGGSWGLWGSTQWRVEPVLQAAALGGVWLLSFLLVAVNIAVARLWLAREGGDRRLAVAVLVAIPALVVMGGTLRPDPAVSGSLRVAGVQPGVFDSARERLDGHLRLTESIQPGAQDIVVWGQSSVSFDPAVEPALDVALRDAARQAGADLLVNVDANSGTKTTMQYTPDGPKATYDKRRLVPFGEYIPLRPLFGWLSGVTQAAEEDRVRGVGPVILSVDGVRIGPLISYESSFPDLRRQLARLDADVTIVQGASWTFQGSWVQPQQASYEAVRAVESGRPAVLVSVSGVSAAFDARGRRLAWIPADEETAFVVDVPLSREATPYVRIGDWVVWLSLLVAVTAALAAIRSRRSAAREQPPGVGQVAVGTGPAEHDDGSIGDEPGGS